MPVESSKGWQYRLEVLLLRAGPLGHIDTETPIFFGVRRQGGSIRHNDGQTGHGRQSDGGYQSLARRLHPPK